MFEAVVSSRIRRALLSHLLTHTHQPFYLRGLAKELGLSVSPLRRELKRLEQSGILRSFREANLVYYVATTDSSAFQELARAAEAPALRPAVAVAAVEPAVLVSPVTASVVQAQARPRRTWSWPRRKIGSTASPDATNFPAISIKAATGCNSNS
jgi:hypothetical protein